LVRRDIEAFEKSCGGVDPDAAAAFKGLLASDKTSVAAAPRRVEVPSKAAEVKPAEVKAAEAKPIEAKPIEAKPVERKIETKIETKAEVAAKPIAKPAAPMAAVALATPPRDAVKSDTEWLNAVRGALKAPAADAEPTVETRVEIKAADAKAAEVKPADVKPAEAKAEEAKTAIAAPLVRQAVREAPPMNIENVRTPPLMTVVAPTLPPPSAVGNVPEPRVETVRADDHPVPPSAIPDPPTDITPPEERSRIGQLISEIPFAKRLLDK
jgi:hypothetical protein